MDSGGEYRAEDDNGDRYECKGDESKGLRFLESSQWQNRGWSKKLIAASGIFAQLLQRPFAD